MHIMPDATNMPDRVAEANRSSDLPSLPRDRVVPVLRLRRLLLGHPIRLSSALRPVRRTRLPTTKGQTTIMSESTGTGPDNLFISTANNLQLDQSDYDVLERIAIALERIADALAPAQSNATQSFEYTIEVREDDVANGLSDVYRVQAFNLDHALIEAQARFKSDYPTTFGTITSRVVEEPPA